MPTRIARLGRERTLATLVKRLYLIDEATDPDLLRRAEARLLAANPRLATAEGFASGASIRVPAVPGLRPAERVSIADASGAGLSSEMATRFETLQGHIDDALRASAVTRRETQARLADRSFLSEARKMLPQSVDYMAAARERLDREGQAEEATAKRLKEAAARALEELKALDALVRRQG